MDRVNGGIKKPAESGLNHEGLSARRRKKPSLAASGTGEAHQEEQFRV
jgi:hypothetical protein